MSAALLPKRQLRGLLASRLRKHIVVAFLFSMGCAAGYKSGVAEPRKREYAEFYKNYGAMKEFEAMRKAEHQCFGIVQNLAALIFDIFTPLFLVLPSWSPAQP
uniref:Cytochrome c oxidase subunit 6C n=1 Tax=Podarcis muralis TaxID=64176 RepID=A0A670K073_PODMU